MSVELSTIMIQILSGFIIFFLGMIAYGYTAKSKIEESKDAAQAAYIDALTKLGNRHKFNKVIAEMVKHEDEKFALCFLDLDDFKHINDNMGHDAGDELLIELGKRLVDGVADHGQVFRLGGDEYALIITDADTKLEVETIIKRVQRNVVRPVDIRGNKVNLDYSLGIAMFPEDTKDSVQLVNFADSAMYYIKESGKSDYYFHNPALRSKTENKKRMEMELKTAFENKEFGIDYQPRVNLKNPKEIWLEAFLYWNHPMVGKLKAEYFLKFAESVGLIIGIDELMIEQAITKLNQLRKVGYSNVNIAMNISLRHFQRKDFVEKLCKIFENNPIEPGTLMLQITDTIDVDKIENYKVMFDKVRKYGVKISIANFEIKHEIMDMFRRLQIDEVKVSSKYIDSNSIFSPNVLKDIVTLARDLKYDIVITRIEDEDTLNKILKLKVDMIQGNYLFNIMDEKDLMAFLQSLNIPKSRGTKKTSKI